eukprot:g31914.t1
MSMAEEILGTVIQPEPLSPNFTRFLNGLRRMSNGMLHRFSIVSYVSQNSGNGTGPGKLPPQLQELVERMQLARQEQEAESRSSSSGLDDSDSDREAPRTNRHGSICHVPFEDASDAIIQVYFSWPMSKRKSFGWQPSFFTISLLPGSIGFVFLYFYGIPNFGAEAPPRIPAIKSEEGLALEPAPTTLAANPTETCFARSRGFGKLCIWHAFCLLSQLGPSPRAQSAPAMLQWILHRMMFFASRYSSLHPGSREKEVRMEPRANQVPSLQGG